MKGIVYNFFNVRFGGYRILVRYLFVRSAYVRFGANQATTLPISGHLFQGTMPGFLF